MRLVLARRRIMAMAAVLLSVGVIGCFPGVRAAENTCEAEKRRIIYNLDGDGCMFTKEGSLGPARITADDMKTVVEEIAYPGSLVDTLLVCINAQVTYYPSNVGTMRGTLDSPEERKKWTRPTEHQRFRNMNAMFAEGVDPYALLLAEAKTRGLEAMLTYRMNDAHRQKFLRCKLWRDHPEYRLGNGLDFGQEAVRDYTFRIIEEAVQRYNCDGIELDFQRFPKFFRKGVGEEQRIVAINSLVKRVREMLDREGKVRGRRLVLAARIPTNYDSGEVTYEASRAVGCDPAAWAKEGWVDFLTVSHFLREKDKGLNIAAWQELIREVPIYGAIQYCHAPGDKAAQYRRKARQLWNDGVDGIYFFNFFCSRELGADSWEPPFEVFRDVGSHIAADDSPGPAIAYPAAGTAFDTIKTDVCVVGGGSGGFGAALAAARAGVEVVLVEQREALGGTSTRALVNNWEPGPGCEFAKELYERIQKTPGVAGVTSDQNPGRKLGPFGLYLWDAAVPYKESTTRAVRKPKDYHTVSFDADKMSLAMREMLEETGRVKILLGTTFVKAHSASDETPAHSKRVESIDVAGPDARRSRIKAKVFIDSTGGVHLCRKLGCKVMLGADPKSRFDEPSAPEEPRRVLNAISRCYEIRKSDHPKRQEKPAPAFHFARTAHITQSGEDILTVNPLPMLPGTALIDHGYDACMERTEKAVAAHWNWLQSFDAFRKYEFHAISPMLGIRESYRVVTKYVLRQQDLAAGWDRQTHDDLIAVADHPCDIHGAGGHLGRVSGPYGVPYRCLLPEGGWTNLMAACRGAGFSKIAASSCRLSRTMIQLGHAAGLGAAMAVKADKPVGEIDIEELTRRLDIRSRYPKTE